MSAIPQPALFTKLGFDPAYLSTFEDKLFIEGPQTARRLTNFFTLLILATVIATYRVLSNSTATVIMQRSLHASAPESTHSSPR